MSEPPRELEARILSLRRFFNLLSYGLAMAAGTLGVLYYGLQAGTPEYAKTLAFTTFVMFQVFNAFNARSEKGTVFNNQFFANTLFWLSILAVILLQITAIHWSAARYIFHTTLLTGSDWLTAVSVAASILILEELRKLLRKIISF